MCLDNRGQAYNEGEIVVWECVDSDNLRWDYDGRFIRSAHDANIVADAYGRGNDAKWVNGSFMAAPTSNGCSGLR